MPTSVVCLGRGVSLKRAWESTIRCNRAYCVNNMDAEIEHTLPISSDEWIHVAGRKGATAMNDGRFDRTVINAIDRKHHSNWKRFKGVKCEYRPLYMKDRGYPSVGWKKVLAGKLHAARKGNNGNCWPTTGLFAIDLACVENHPCKMYLFGFDFYRKPYLVKPNRPYQTQKNPKVKCMFKYMQKLVNEFQDIQFYSASKLGMKGDNWHEI